jgi:hypothetical protein
MKYIVWIKKGKGSTWEQNGEGPLTLKQAERIAKETRGLCYAIRVLPSGFSPL